MSMHEMVERQRAERFDVLRQLYALCGGHTMGFVDFRGKIEGYDDDTAQRHVMSLRDLGLVEWRTAWTSGVTALGILEVEAVYAEQPTVHFPSLAVIETYVHVAGDMSGQMQVGTRGSTQTAGITGDALRGVLEEVRALVNDLVLDADEAAVIEADLNSAEAQVSLPRPNGGIVHAALSSVQKVLEGVATRGAIEGAERVPGAAEKLTDLIEHIGRVMGQIT